MEEKFYIAEKKLQENRERFRLVQNDLNNTLEQLYQARSFDSSFSYAPHSETGLIARSSSSFIPESFHGPTSKQISPVVKAHRQMLEKERKMKILGAQLSQKATTLEKVRQTITSSLKTTTEASSSPPSHLQDLPSRIAMLQASYSSLQLNHETLQQKYDDLHRQCDALRQQYSLLLKDYHTLLEEKEELLFRAETNTSTFAQPLRRRNEPREGREKHSQYSTPTSLFSKGDEGKHFHGRERKEWNFSSGRRDRWDTNLRSYVNASENDKKKRSGQSNTEQDEHTQKRVWLERERREGRESGPSMDFSLEREQERLNRLSTELLLP